MKDKLSSKSKGGVPINTIHKIMDNAIQINKDCKEFCRDFTLMESDVFENTLILRWTTIDISNIDKPIQCYRYQCFFKGGSPQNCSIHYSDQEEANDFFQSLNTLYKQEFSIDHTLK